MTTPSLGERLRDLVCATPDCIRALEREANEKGLCAERDLQLVRDFFYRASTEFATAILAGVAPRPLMIGNGQNDKLAAVLHTYRWKDGYDIRGASHPLHGIWTPFQAWCDANDLRPCLTSACDGAARERWYLLSVSPSAQPVPLPPPATPVQVR